MLSAVCSMRCNPKKSRLYETGIVIFKQRKDQTKLMIHGSPYRFRVVHLSTHRKLLFRGNLKSFEEVLAVLAVSIVRIRLIT